MEKELNGHLQSTLQDDLNKLVDKIRSCGCKITTVVSRGDNAHLKNEAYIVQIDDRIDHSKMYDQILQDVTESLNNQ